MKDNKLNEIITQFCLTQIDSTRVILMHDYNYYKLYNIEQLNLLSFK